MNKVSFYIREIEKEASSLSTIGKISPIKRIGAGMTIGAGLGAYKYKPEYDEAGNQIDTGKATSAVAGAGVGGLVGSALGSLKKLK